MIRPGIAEPWARGDYGSVLAQLFPIPHVDPALIFWLLVALMLAQLWRLRRKATHKRPLYIPLRLGGKTIDLQPTRTDSIHTVIGGTSGLGKSTTILPLLDLPVGVLVLALDNTRPIADYVRSLPDGIEWSNEPGSPGWGTKLDILSGPPSIASEALVAGWSAKTESDTGKYRQIARDRLWRILDELDAQGEPRTMLAIVGMMMADAKDGESNRACRDWARRIERLYRQIGDCLGTDLNLVQAMRDRKKVLLRLNSFLMPEESPMLGGMWLVMARRVAQEAGVPFVLIIEEAGQLGRYKEQIIPLSQAGRDRGVPTILLTQNMSQLPLQVVNNTTLWISFAQNAPTEVKFAAEVVGLTETPELVKRSAFRNRNGGRGWAWIRSDTIDPTLVKIKQHRPRKSTQIVPFHAPSPVAPPFVPSTCTVFEVPTETHALPEPTEPKPEWVTKDPDRQKIWKRLYRDSIPSVLFHPDKGIYPGGPCLLYHKPSSDGRPRLRLPSGGNATAYIEVFKWAGGYIPPSFTIDHLCGVPNCCEPDHLEAVTNEENVRRRSARVKALALISV